MHVMSYVLTISVHPKNLSYTQSLFILFTRFYGGDTSLLTTEAGIPAWQKTVSNKPWLFSGSLFPIHDIIPDKRKRNNMERVVKVCFG